MLKEKWNVVEGIIVETIAFLGLGFTYPEDCTSECQAFIDEHKKLIIKLDDKVYLIFSSYLGDRFKAELVAENLDYTKKAEWEKIMRDKYREEFSTSSFGFFGHEHYIDLRHKGHYEVNPDQREEAPVSEQAVPTEPTQKKSEPKKSNACPECGEKVTVEDEDDIRCEECDTQLWRCPRCNELVTEDPDETKACPKCEKSWTMLDCPECGKDFYDDLSACPHCKKEFGLGKCPNCDMETTKVSSNECCSGCDTNLYLCPRCNEFVSEDPDESTSCEKCKQSLCKVECPNCNEEIWSDSAKCPECNTEFTLSQCPHCDEKLIPIAGIGECPYCRENIYLCPRCQQYIEDDPDDTDSCPKCEKTLKTFECECGQDLFIDTETCPHCHEEILHENCPGCEEDIPSELDTCPRCGDDLEITECPRCKTKHYSSATHRGTGSH